MKTIFIREKMKIKKEKSIEVDNIVEIISQAIDKITDDNGWASTFLIGNIINRKKPNFNLRAYGCTKNIKSYFSTSKP